MKKIIYLLLLLWIACNAFSQGLLHPEWIHTQISSFGGRTEGWSVSVDHEGNIYWPVSSDSTGQGLDIFCYKYDSSGNSLWLTPFFFGGVGTQHAFVSHAKDTALYIGGRYCAFFGTSCDMQLIKINKSNGMLQWAKTIDFGHNGYDEIDGLEILEDGIYAGGWAQAIQPGSYQIDIGLIKMDFDGNTLWSNYAGKAGTAEHQDGHFVVDANYIFAAGEWDGKNLANLYNGYSFLGKFSKKDGSLIDSTLFGFQSNSFLDAENALGMTSDGTYLYITGYTTPHTSNDWQIFVAKFDKNLNQLWFKHWGGSNSESARGIAINNGVVFIAGVTNSPEYNRGEKADAVLLAYDTAGNFLQYKTWGDTLDNEFRDIAISGKDIYLAGSSGNNLFNGDSDNGFVMKVKINDILTSVHEPPFRHGSVLVHPNPCTSNVTIDIHSPYADTHDIKLFTIFGQLVFQKTLQTNPETISFELPGGMYVYTLRNSAGDFIKGKIIIQK